MVYIVTAIKELSDTNTVEVAGVFDTLPKAFKAQAMVEKWMVDNEYDNYEVFVCDANMNHLCWYEIEENIKEN